MAWKLLILAASIAAFSTASASDIPDDSQGKHFFHQILKINEKVLHIMKCNYYVHVIIMVCLV